MEVQFTDLVPSLQTLFSTDADLAALQACLIRRRRKITGAAFAQGLVFGWLQNPDATSADLTASLARAGAAIKPQSLDGRFTPQAAGFFRLLLDKALAKVLAPPSRALGLLARFKGVYLIDGTTIPLPAVLAEAWPGCGGTAAAVAGKASLKAVVRYEVSGGAITGLSLHAGKTSDVGTPPHRAPLPPRSLRLADLGFFGLDDLAGVDEQDAYYLTRIKSICMVYDQQGRKCKLARYLARQKGDRLDRCLWLGEGKRLKGRLLAIRTPEAVAAKRRCEAKEEAQRHGRQVSEETLALCGWTVFFTNVPRGVLSLQEAWVMYRVRWQIELLFKMWKSDGKVDESRSGKPERVLCEVCAKLLGMVAQHWLLLASGGAQMGEKSRRQAAAVVRGQMAHVAAVVRDAAALGVAVAVMAAMVAAVPGVRKRKGRPATYQTLLDPFNDGLSAEAGQDPRAEPSYEEDEDGGEGPPPPSARKHGGTPG